MQGLVTVFGGGGFVGAQVVRALAKKNLRVRVAIRQPGRAYKMRMLGDVGQVEVVQANVRDPQSVARALDGASAVVNLVGVLYEHGRQTFEAIHVEAAGEVARAAAARGITTFVQMSALGADASSSSAYARTKAKGEAAVRNAIPSAIIVRPSIVFGIDDKFFNLFGGMSAISPALPLVGGGDTKIQPVFVGDVAAAIAKAVSDPSLAGATLELGGPAVHTLRELLQTVLTETRHKRMLLPLPWPVAKAIGAAFDIQTKVLGAFGLGGAVAPLITSDQVEMLKSDNVVSAGAIGLADLGIEATPLQAVLPSYLYRYRKGGQFAELAPV